MAEIPWLLQAASGVDFGEYEADIFGPIGPREVRERLGPYRGWSGATCVGSLPAMTLEAKLVAVRRHPGVAGPTCPVGAGPLVGPERPIPPEAPR